MRKKHENTSDVTRLILKARDMAREEVQAVPEPELTRPVEWPVTCTVGPGLEGAIACETKIGYVNGTKGALIYRGYDIFDLCAYSTFEEVSYLLVHGELPNETQLKAFKAKLSEYRRVPKTVRLLMGFPIAELTPMAALRMGTNLMRQEFTWTDLDEGQSPEGRMISADEDSIPMETKPRGERKAVYEFKSSPPKRPRTIDPKLHHTACLQSAYHLIAGVASVAGAVNRVRNGGLPLEPDDSLSHAGNLIYMITGRKPTPVEERVTLTTA